MSAPAARPDCKRTALGRALRLVAVRALAAASMFLAAPAVCLAATPAATVIDNQAQLTFTTPDGDASLTSNRVSLQVQELLDVEVEVITPEREVTAGAGGQILTFRVRNRGNGAQAFDLALDLEGDDDFDPHGCVTMVDWNLDGVAEQTVDPIALVTPILQPGQSVDVWAACSIPSTALAGSRGGIRLTAFPSALRGMTEAQLAAAGPDGVAMVFGRSFRARGLVGAAVSNHGAYRIGPATPAAPRAQLIKTQSVRDSRGGAQPITGATITYSLEARFDAGMAARKVRVTDAIPIGVAYVPGSLTLDGMPLTDDDDGDTGRFAAGQIDVALGDSPAASRLVTFQVRITSTGSSS